MPDKIRVKISDFYSNAVGDVEFVYVSMAVYETLANTFRREDHTERMRDLRHTTPAGYLEGETEGYLVEAGEALEDMVIQQMDIEILQRAMQSLTEIQKERLHLYFFEDLSMREIAERHHTNQSAVWKSIQGAIKKIKKFYK